MLAAVFEDTLPETIPQKKAFLLEHHIALWDVIASCDIAGSSDSSIRNVTANDMEVILKTADIRRICANGDTAYRLFSKYCLTAEMPEVKKLPSYESCQCRMEFRAADTVLGSRNFCCKKKRGKRRCETYEKE